MDTVKCSQMQLPAVIHSLNLQSSQEPGLDHSLNSLSFPALSLKPCAHILRKLAWCLKQRCQCQKESQWPNAKSILGFNFQGTPSVFNPISPCGLPWLARNCYCQSCALLREKKSPQLQSIWLALSNNWRTPNSQEQPSAADTKAKSWDSEF